VQGPESKSKQSKIDQRFNEFANHSKKNRLIAFGIVVALIIVFYTARYFIERAGGDAASNQLNQTFNSQGNP
jgi:hypothetical protein